MKNSMKIQEMVKKFGYDISLKDLEKILDFYEQSKEVVQNQILTDEYDYHF